MHKLILLAILSILSNCIGRKKNNNTINPPESKSLQARSFSPKYSDTSECGAINQNIHPIDTGAFLKLATSTKEDLILKFNICVFMDTDEIDENQVKTTLSELNKYFLNARMHFILPAKIIKIDYVDAHNFVRANHENGILKKQFINSINVFIFNSVYSDSEYVGAYAVKRKNFIMFKAAAFNDARILAHEMGHVFGLHHTHGKTNDGSTDELVSRRDCEIRGDDICDTPADPNLKNEILPGCTYTGTKKDSEDQIFTPDPKNIMSYSKVCREKFSPQQNMRMRMIALTDHSTRVVK